MIQMGSVVHGEIPSCVITGGNHAQVFAWRDKKLICIQQQKMFK